MSNKLKGMFRPIELGYIKISWNLVKIYRKITVNFLEEQKILKDKYKNLSQVCAIILAHFTYVVSSLTHDLDLH